MKIKLEFKYPLLPLILALFLLVPGNIVWGGNSFQTVPTIGPTKTPAMSTVFTATQPISTQTSVEISTSTAVFITPAAATATSTVKATATSTAKATQKTLSETSEPEKTESISTTEVSSLPESTSIIVLPLVSNEDSTPAEQTRQEENSPIPAFVFPMVVILLFVIIYFVTRLSLKKSLDESSPK